ncbi:Glutathione amide reductase [bacterium HR39]|nr:Glutathione amide reductase [bacterium HR39]
MAHYDLFVIGGGSGGIACARRAASHGARVALAEAGRLGGTCVIRGCVPKKLMHYAARLRDRLSLLPGYGFDLDPPVFDFRRLLENRNREIRRLEGIYHTLLESSGVHLYRGRARIDSDGTPPHGVVVDGERHTAERVVVAVGSRPVLPDVPGIEHAVTSDFLLEEVYEQPRRMVVVGAGYIGIELASIFNALGTRVQLVMRRELPLRGFDQELRIEIAEALVQAGIDLVPEARVERIEASDGTKLVVTDRGVLEADLVLFATGRHAIPNTRGLGLAEAGVRMTLDGVIHVDVGYETNVPGIHAIGDCSDHAGHGLDPSQHDLTPVAIAEGRALAERWFNDNPEVVNYETIPTAVFGLPEAASVGLGEERARALGYAVEVYRTRFRPMLYTLPGLERRFFAKLVVDADSDRVLGLHVVGEDAAEIVQGFAVAMTAGATKRHFDETVALHPTSAEELVLMYQPVSGAAGERTS